MLHMKKVCSKCKIEKDFSEFNRHSKNKDGYQGKCRCCAKKYHIDNKDAMNLKEKKYRLLNKDKISKRTRQYRIDNKDKMAKRGKAYRLKNKEKIAHKSKIYRDNNKDKSKKYREDNKDKLNLYFKHKRHTDIQRKLSGNLRRRTNKALKNNYKSGSAVSDLGCSIQELKLYLENMFYTNKETGEIMGWDNYGTKGWHIDHVIPISSFDLTKREELLVACNYTNLQPLWAKDNLSKGAKLDYIK